MTRDEKMIDAKEIEKIIPHRGDMRLVDEIREITDTTAVGIKHVTDHEFWCSGHFPGHPIMPGVLIVEALAQTACFTTLNRIGNNNGKILGYFVSIEKARFSRMVVPGDTLELHIEELGSKMTMYRYSGTAVVNGVKAASVIFSAIMDNGEK